MDRGIANPLIVLCLGNLFLTEMGHSNNLKSTRRVSARLFRYNRTDMDRRYAYEATVAGIPYVDERFGTDRASEAEKWFRESARRLTGLDATADETKYFMDGHDVMRGGLTWRLKKGNRL